MTWWSRLWKRSAPAAPREGARQAGKLKSEYHTELTSERSPESPPALPFYAAIERSRTSGAHKDFSYLEDSPEVNRLRDLFESELLSSNRCPTEDKPLFTTLLSGPSGVFTVTLPDSNPCLLIFSTPLRAADYARIHGASLQLKYLSSTPREFVQMLTDLSRNSAIQRFALDVCPYCLTFPVLTFSPGLTPAAVVKIWAIHKSGELARESVYFARFQGVVPFLLRPLPSPAIGIRLTEPNSCSEQVIEIDAIFRHVPFNPCRYIVHSVALCLLNCCAHVFLLIRFGVWSRP